MVLFPHSPPHLHPVFDWEAYYGNDILIVVVVIAVAVAVAVTVLLLLLVIATTTVYSFLLITIILFHLIYLVIRNDSFHHEHCFVKLLLFYMPTLMCPVCRKILTYMTENLRCCLLINPYQWHKRCVSFKKILWWCLFFLPCLSITIKTSPIMYFW